MKRTTVTMAALLALLSPTALAAQEVAAPQRELPGDVAERAVTLFNAPGTIRLTGEVVVPGGRVIQGDLAVLGGTVELGGTIDGDLLVVNGGLLVREGARVSGAVLVVGGTITGDSTALAGSVEAYAEPLRYRRDGERLVYTPPRAQPEIRAGRAFDFGRTDLSVAVQRGYNRVEGLPIAIGPRMQFGFTNPTIIDARLIYRTASGLTLDTEELGWLLRAEQAIGGTGWISAVAGVRSEILPIESGGLSDRENSLATFLLHRDYRDHYEREGWFAGVRLTPERSASSLSLEFHDEKHRTVAAASPWSLFDNDDPWRPQPISAEGEFQSLVLSYRLDTRNDEIAPSAGWFATGAIEQAVGGDLSLVLPPREGADAAVQRVDARFLAGSIDVRRYLRVSRHARLLTRVYAAGSLDDEPLPPQRQHALGGEGTLPGYPLFRFDCGARITTGTIGGEPFHPYYGCDRAALVQLEYEAAFPFVQSLNRLFGTSVDLTNAGGWVLFFDAGRAWTEQAARNGRGAGQDDFAADAGFGLRLGRLGAYWAFPLSGSGDGVNFFLRVDRRI